MLTETQRLQKLLDDAKNKVFTLINNIYWVNENLDESLEEKIIPLARIKEANRLKLSIEYWVSQSKLNKKGYTTLSNLSEIAQTLKIFANMQNDSNAPFERFMTARDHHDPEVRDMLESYHNSYRQTFLPYFRNEIKDVLTSNITKKHFEQITSIKVDLQKVNKMHTNPKKYLEGTFQPTQHQAESKVKKYVTRAAVVLTGILLVAMAVKLFPLSMLAAGIMHMTMYATTGVSLLGYAEERWAKYKAKKQTKAVKTKFQHYNAELRNVSTFFNQKPKADKIMPAALSVLRFA